MMRVELIRGRDYRGHGVKASLGEPFTVSDDKASELVETGFFKADAIESENGATAGENSSDDDNKSDEDGNKADADDDNKSDEEKNSGDAGESHESEDKQIEKMKKDELIALAAEKQIDISECANNEERIAMIKDAIESENGVTADFTE